jgi:hypothetical protein
VERGVAQVDVAVVAGGQRQAEPADSHHDHPDEAQD